MIPPAEHQAKALGEALALRTPAEWHRKVEGLDRELTSGQEIALTAEEYTRLLAPVIRLRLRRALMHALQDGAISAPAAAQLLGFLRHSRNGELEQLLDPALFPNLDSADFAFLHDVKHVLHNDVKKLKAASNKAPADP